jgi:hypothetical protein
MKSVRAAVLFCLALLCSCTAVSAQSYYGSGFGSDGLGNTIVGGPYRYVVSYRFRARHTGYLKSVRVYLIPDAPGYARGTGGRLLISVHADDGSVVHQPTGPMLARYTIEKPLAATGAARVFPRVTFNSPVWLVSGRLYHIVFTNVDANPSANYLSVNALWQQKPGNPAQPLIPDTDWAALYRYTTHGWKQRKGYAPILQLEYADGWTGGMGYLEAWIGAPRAISGSLSVRQRLTVRGSSRKVSSISVRVARLRGTNPLIVRLETGSGALIEQGSISASAVPLTTSLSWTTYTFKTPHTLSAGQTYNLVLQASATTVYQTYPIRKGSYYGFGSGTYFADGNAQFKVTTSWVGWTQWGVANRTDGDLQFAFRLAP